MKTIPLHQGHSHQLIIDQSRFHGKIKKQATSTHVPNVTCLHGLTGLLKEIAPTFIAGEGAN